MSNQWAFVVAAYTLTWAVTVGYAVFVEIHWRRVRRAGDEGLHD